MPIAEIEALVTGMCQLQKHGGPDGEGILSCAENKMVLGHRRLSLLDLGIAGKQPMQYRQRYHISYNGELYNFPELKATLSSLGHRFSNQTDTEVILAAFAQWNTQAFSKFNGIFAFALWDSMDKAMYLVRDPAGIKPLYYSTHSESLAFASELRALESISFLNQKNHNWPVYLLAYGHIPEPETTLAQVKPLPKGCFYKYHTGSGIGSLQRFAHFSFSQQFNNKAVACQEIKTTLQAAVKRQLIADARIGVFLSGGLDSSIITLEASQTKHEQLNTLSLYFEEAAYSEKKYQDKIIEKLHCNHYQHLLKEEEFHQSFPAILKAMDMPCSDGINTWFISKYAAQQGLKAVLSGIGGDELFGGYPSFRRIGASRFLHHISARGIRYSMHTPYNKLNRFSYLGMEGIKGIYLFLRGHFTPYDIAKQLGATQKEVWDILNELPVLPEIKQLGLKNQASWMEYHLYMQNQLLRDADVMSMAHGVEIRVPFLDNDMIRLAFKMNAGIKYAGPKPKQILINSFKNELPEAVWNRPKMGFTLPFAKWLGNNELVEQCMQNGDANCRNHYQQFKKGQVHWSQLMSLLILKKRGG